MSNDTRSHRQTRALAGLGALCSLCVDNVVGYRLTIGTAAGNTTEAVVVCWPCLVDRLEDLQHDLVAFPEGDRVRLSNVTWFYVETLEPMRRAA